MRVGHGCRRVARRSATLATRVHARLLAAAHAACQTLDCAACTLAVCGRGPAANEFDRRDRTVCRIFCPQSAGQRPAAIWIAGIVPRIRTGAWGDQSPLDPIVSTATFAATRLFSRTPRRVPNLGRDPGHPAKRRRRPLGGARPASARTGQSGPRHPVRAALRLGRLSSSGHRRRRCHFGRGHLGHCRVERSRSRTACGAALLPAAPPPPVECR